MEGGFGGGQPVGLAAALARGRRPPKAGGGPTKYHRLAFKNSLHQVGISPSACKAANSYLFSTPPAPADPLCPPSAVVPSSDSPNAETRNTISCTKPPNPALSYTTPSPPLSSETASTILRSCSCVHISGPTP